MINIFSLNCGLAFAPYLSDSAAAYLKAGAAQSRVVRQGGSGLIVRSDGEMMLRYQNRESALAVEEARHYYATIQFRSEVYDILRMSDEIVLANFGRSLLLSHPQSELWLEAAIIDRLLSVFKNQPRSAEGSTRLPEWLNVSAGGGRLLISDQRNARWALLGADHIAEMQRRLASLDAESEPPAPLAPPTIPLKTITIHLQSAFRLVESLEAFAATGAVDQFEERAPRFYLGVAKATEGMEIKDSNARVALQQREARKWAEIIKSELSRLNASRAERGRIRTVFADGSAGRWALQWGDEALVPDETISRIRLSQEMRSEEIQSQEAQSQETQAREPAVKRAGELLLLLTRATGSCVALTEPEVKHLSRES